MARPFSELPNFLDGLTKKFIRKADQLHRNSARKAGFAVTNATRVDTGRARSNWIATIGTPSNRSILPYAPGRGLGIGETANLIGATNQQSATVARWIPSKGRPLFITNNVRYIGALNEGSSGRRPASFGPVASQAWKLGFLEKVGGRV